MLYKPPDPKSIPQAFRVAFKCGPVEIPPIKGDAKGIANWQFELIHKNPYRYTSVDIFFQIFAEKNNLPVTVIWARQETVFIQGGKPVFGLPL